MENQPGALVISLDFELHWGVRDKRSQDGTYHQNILGVRHAIPRMLDLFEKFNIAATWATVGFLFARSRQEREAFSPALRPTYQDTSLSPYDETTGTGEEDDPLHFAPGLIEMIASRPGQEIGSHTFSHYYCLEPGQTREAFQADLESAVAIAQTYGIQLSSLIFPRNQFNPEYVDVIKANGIACYRGNEQAWMYRASTSQGSTVFARRIGRMLDTYLPVSGLNLVSWDTIMETNGLCNLPSSCFLRPYKPALRYFEKLRLKRIVDSLKAAATSRKIFHLWWHPHNFGIHTDENIEFLWHVLEAFDRFKKEYGMQSLNMQEITGLIQERKSP